jgi:hypothetical protein
MGKRSSKQLRQDNEDALARRLACPYFKRDPVKYQEERSCVGPGWKRVHRIK